MEYVRILTDVISPVRRLLDQAIAPAVGVGHSKSVDNIRPRPHCKGFQSKRDTSESIDDITQTLPLEEIGHIVGEPISHRLLRIGLFDVDERMLERGRRGPRHS